jgi:AcrR family transcriptional regulator
MGRTSDAKERLLEAVIELIWTCSYGSTSVDQICERAGVKKGSFYHFFESKTELAVAGIEHSWNEHRKQLDQTFSPVIPPLERIWKSCENFQREQREALEKFGAENGLTGNFEALSQSPQVRESLQADVDTLNEGLNRWETIKKFAILPVDWTEAGGQLTAKLSLKRGVVMQESADEIAALYS